jgi:hypothetical protein
MCRSANVLSTCFADVSIASTHGRKESKWRRKIDRFSPTRGAVMPVTGRSFKLPAGRLSLRVCDAAPYAFLPAPPVRYALGLRSSLPALVNRLIASHSIK